MSAVGTLVPLLAREHELAGRFSRSNLPILLLGETGTGKEVIARAIHRASGRRGPFVAVNCAALPKGLLEAQLFGHTKGAFSGATRDEVGFVRAANGGTLFLDEIGDLPASAQAVLLRVLQEGEVVPLGTTRSERVDLRVIAATHQPLEQMTQQGTFRGDLLARLQGYTHRLWRLADRSEDVGLIMADVLSRAARPVQIAPDAASAIVRYPWPLNVRELVHALSHALALCGEIIELEHLPPAVAAFGEGARKETRVPEALSPADQVLHDDLTRRLTTHSGNVAAVARDVGKAPMQVYRWMQRLGIDPQAFRR
jgi:DNA-binding NtrC family response regulator